MIEYLRLILACQLLGQFTVGAMIGPFILNLLKIKRLGGARICYWYCKPWNRYGPRTSGE